MSVSPVAFLSLRHGRPWPNRIALAPLTNTQSRADGSLSAEEITWLAARARGGFGLTMTAAAYVADAGKAWAGQLGVGDDAFAPGLQRLAGLIAEPGSASAVQLHHAGRRADPAVSGVQRVSAFDDAPTDTRALTTDEVRRAIEDFAAAAVRVERAGFDGVELHGAHGYLIGQFLDGRRNHRTDGYGGSLEDRMRFAREAVDAVRAATGPDFTVGLRLTPERHGIVLAEAVETVRTLLADDRLDYLDLSLWDVRKAPHELTGDDRLLLDHFTGLFGADDAAASRPTRTRLGVAGEIASAADVAWCLDRGADFVLVGTAAIIHHDFATRVLADPGFVADPQPVSRERLAAESVSPAFVDYLAAGWDNFVA